MPAPVTTSPVGRFGRWIAMPLGPEKDMENSHRISLRYAVLRGPSITLLGDGSLGSPKKVKMVTESVVSSPPRSAGLICSCKSYSNSYSISPRLMEERQVSRPQIGQYAPTSTTCKTVTEWATNDLLSGFCAVNGDHEKISCQLTAEKVTGENQANLSQKK